MKQQWWWYSDETTDSGSVLKTHYTQFSKMSCRSFFCFYIKNFYLK